MDRVRPSPGATGGATILVVDDDDDVREVTAATLARRGHAVLTANGGAEALRICARHPGRIDLLLTDVEMPRMTGPLLARAVRAIRPETRVLFMSGTAAAPDLDAPLVDKPFTVPALVRRVGALLRTPLDRHSLKPSA